MGPGGAGGVSEPCAKIDMVEANKKAHVSAPGEGGFMRKEVSDIVSELTAVLDALTASIQHVPITY